MEALISHSSISGNVKVWYAAAQELRSAHPLSASFSGHLLAQEAWQGRERHIRVERNLDQAILQRVFLR